MKNLIAAMSIVLLLGIGLILVSQMTAGAAGKGDNNSGCQNCIESLVASIKSTVGQIIVGGNNDSDGNSNGSDLSKQIVIIIGVPSERAGQLANDFNNCCIDNGCTSAMLIVR